MEYYNTVTTILVLDCSLLGDHHPATEEGMSLEAAVVCYPVETVAETLACPAAQTFAHPEGKGAKVGVGRLVAIRRYNFAGACFH